MHASIQTKLAAVLLVALALFTNTVESFIQRAKAEFEAITSLSKMAAEEIMRGADPYTAAERSAKRMAADRGQTDIVGVAIALVVVGAVVFVGINIMSQTIDQTALTSGDPLYNASQDFETTMGDMFGFIGLALLAAFLAVIIYYLTSVRGGGAGFGR
jgi:hypothetical protein